MWYNPHVSSYAVQPILYGSQYFGKPRCLVPQVFLAISITPPWYLKCWVSAGFSACLQLLMEVKHRYLQSESYKKPFSSLFQMVGAVISVLLYQCSPPQSLVFDP